MRLLTGKFAPARPGSVPDDEQLFGALVRVTTAALSVPATVQITANPTPSSRTPDATVEPDAGPLPTSVENPLIDATGHAQGFLRANTRLPDALTAADLALLRDAAAIATSLLVSSRKSASSAAETDNSDDPDRSLLETVLATTDCGIMVCDADGRLLIANPAAVALAGVQSGQSAEHRSGSVCLLEPDGTPIPHSEWPLIRALQDGAVDGRMVCVPGPDATMRYHRCSARQLRSRDGLLFGAVCIISDITDLYERTAQLQADRDRAEKIIGTASDAFFSFDADHLLREWNTGAERLFGFSHEEVLGQRLDDVFLAADAGHELSANLAQGCTFEMQAHSRSGKPIALETCGWITEADGLTSYTVFVRDITERKALEISQTRAYDELTQALDSMRRSVALVKVIHDDQGNPDHLVASWLNQFMLEAFNLDLSAAEGRPLSELFPGVAAAGLLDRYLEVARTGEPLHEVIDHFDDGIVSGCFELSVTPWSVDGLLIEVTNVTRQRSAEIAMKRSQRMLANSHRAAGIGSYEYDVARDETVWSAEMYGIFGIDPSDGPPSAAAFFDAIHPEDRSTFRKNFLEELQGMTEREYIEYRCVRPDGGIRHLSDWLYYELDGDGRLVRVTGAVQDQTERREREIALAHSRELERLVVDLSPIGIALIDENGYFIKVNNAFCAMQGRTRDALLRTNFIDVSHPDDRDNALAKHAQVADGKIVGVNYDERYVHANGRQFWVSVHKTLLQAADSPYPPRILAQVVDISDRQQRADELTRQARTDQLTGLANRRTWEPRLASALAEAQRSKTPLSVAIFDLDKFKQFNDTYGHPVGDELLAETSAAWRAYLIRHAPRGLIARLGGEEFGVLLPRCDAAAAAKVLAGMSAVVQRGQTASAGFAVALPSDDVHTIMTRADTALYAAKNAGRARVEFGAAA